MFTLDSIPDISQRFPEGFGGVDMTPGRDFSDPYASWGYDDYDYEPSEEEPAKRMFEVGDEFRIVGIYGGVTTYKVEEIDRDNERILLAEFWEDLDGTGTRPAQWHKLVNEDGNEKALEYYSTLLECDCWIFANGNNY